MSKTVIKHAPNGMPMLAHKSSNAVALLQISDGPSSAVKRDKKSLHKPSTVSVEEEEGKSEWIPWGINDQFPIDIAKLMRKSTVGRSGLQRLTKYIYGQRLITYKVSTITDSGKEVIELVDIPEWREICARSNIKATRLMNAQDYTYYAIAWVELIFTKDKTKVHSFHTHKAKNVRFAPVNEKTGMKEYAYVSGNFPEVTADKAQKIKVIDMLHYPMQIEEIRNDKSTFKYLMPLYWPDPINDYYPVAFWDSVRESGWLDIAISVPAYKKSLFKNQISLKYLIDVPMSYFRFRYNDWDKLDQQSRDQIIVDFYEEANDMLTGAENAQKAIMSFSDTDRQGKEIGGLKVTPIDDKMKQGLYLPESQAANSEILFGMGMNPAISGQGNTGGSYSGGANNGGSNIRESGLDLRSQLRADRDILLMFFDFIKLYNGFPDDVEIGVQDMVLTTLDEGKGTEKVVS